MLSISAGNRSISKNAIFSVKTYIHSNLTTKLNTKLPSGSTLLHSQLQEVQSGKVISREINLSLNMNIAKCSNQSNKESSLSELNYLLSTIDRIQNGYDNNQQHLIWFSSDFDLVKLFQSYEFYSKSVRTDHVQQYVIYVHSDCSPSAYCSSLFRALSYFSH